MKATSNPTQSHKVTKESFVLVKSKNILSSCLRVFVLAFFTGLLPLSAWGAQTTNGTNQEAAPWLRMPVSARSAGMGDAFGAMGEDVSSLGLNPAGLAVIDTPQALFLHNTWFQGMSQERVVGGLPLGDIGVLGLSFDYFNLGSVDTYSIGAGNTLVSNGALSPFGLDGEISYARNIVDHIAMGASLKYIQENLVGTPNVNFALDAGLLVHDLIPHFSFGVAVLNAGGNINGSLVPAEMKTSVAFKTGAFGDSALNFDVDMDVPLAQSLAVGLKAGVEYWYQNKLALRVGEYFSADRADGNGDQWNNGTTLGAGLDLTWGRLDYAFQPYGALGSSHLVSLLTRF